MTTVSNVDSTAASQASLTASATSSMDSDAFLQMLMAQLKYQDPTKPMDSAEMVSQMSDLTMIESMSEMTDTVKDLGTQMYSSQSLYASTLVGQNVSVFANVIDIEEGETVSGKVLMPTSADDLRIEVLDKDGEIIATLPLGEQTETGEVEFDLADLEDELPAGKYTLNAVATIDNNETEAAITQDTTVTGVVIPGQGQEVLVEVDNIGLVPLSYITRMNGVSSSVSQSEVNNYFNRQLLEQYEGLEDSELVDNTTDTAAPSTQAMPPSPAALAMAQQSEQTAQV